MEMSALITKITRKTFFNEPFTVFQMKDPFLGDILTKNKLGVLLILLTLVKTQSVIMERAGVDDKNNFL